MTELRRRGSSRPKDGGKSTAGASVESERSSTEDLSGLESEIGRLSSDGRPIVPAVVGEKPGKPSLAPVLEEKRRKKQSAAKWGCLDSCVWAFGMFSMTAMSMLVALQLVPTGSGTDYLLKLTGSPLPESPGRRLAKEGLKKHHPVVFVPGIVTGGLELWQGRECAEGMFRERLWGGTFVRALQRPGCWMEHIMMNNETGLDPPGIRVRPVSGLVAADYFMPGYFVWAPLIESLAQVGYDERSLHMAAYDWRISFQNTEVRDRTMTRLKNAIETLKATNDNQKVVVIPHSMGALMFFYFMKWVETPAPLGGGGGPTWMNDHVAACINIGPPFLGAPKAVAALLSGEMRDMAELRAIAPFLAMSPFGRHTLTRLMSMLRSWDSIASMLPKGGEAIWGGVDWSPEEGYPSITEEVIGEPYDGLEEKTEGGMQPKRAVCSVDGDAKETGSATCSVTSSGAVGDCHTGRCEGSSKLGGVDHETKGEHSVEVSVKESGNEKTVRLRKRWSTIGRMLSFGKDVALNDLSEDDVKNFGKDGKADNLEEANSSKVEPAASVDCGDAWTEYAEMAPRLKEKIAKRKIYTISAALELLREVAPRLMKRIDQSWSMGLASNVSEPKYADPRYWASALEARLPDAPSMSMYCMYGVGKLTERAYVYKTSESNDSCTIPFHIETSADSLFSRETEDVTPQSSEKTVVKYGVQLTDGDGTVPLISNGFMCARAWRGKTQFNPSGLPVFTREYKHVPPSSLLEGRGHLSGDHVDVMGNFLLLEDVIRVVTGSSGEDLGGDQIHSDIIEISKRAKVKV